MRYLTLVLGPKGDRGPERRVDQLFDSSQKCLARILLLVSHLDKGAMLQALWRAEEKPILFSDSVSASRLGRHAVQFLASIVPEKLPRRLQFVHSVGDGAVAQLPYHEGESKPHIRIVLTPEAAHKLGKVLVDKSV